MVHPRQNINPVKNYNYQEDAFGEKIYVLAAKEKWGNINVKYDLQWKIFRELILIVLWGCLFQISRATIHKNLFVTFVKVLSSRKRNIKGGILYL